MKSEEDLIDCLQELTLFLAANSARLIINGSIISLEVYDNSETFTEFKIGHIVDADSVENVLNDFENNL